uniref:Uncharacterized protein n=1 Tax=Anguilla anguilla TaxID=7936 RepID=A0A0E9XG52_ANGAN
MDAFLKYMVLKMNWSFAPMELLHLIVFLICPDSVVLVSCHNLI